MKIVINGKEQEVAAGIGLAGLIELKGLNPGAVVIEMNQHIIARDKWPGVILCAGDKLEIVAFVGGG